MNVSRLTRTFIPLADHPALTGTQKKAAREAFQTPAGRNRYGTILVRVYAYRNSLGKVSARGGVLRLCLHPEATRAPDLVFTALLRALSGRLHRHPVDPAALELLRFFAVSVSENVPSKGGPAPGRPPQGTHHDLQAVYDSVNREWFDGQVVASIEWMKRPAYRKLAEYHPVQSRIRVSPLLDHPDVPNAYLDFLVYHEMLHAFLGGREAGSKKIYHHKRFLEMEAAHPGYGAALRFERAFLSRFRKRRVRRAGRSTPRG